MRQQNLPILAQVNAPLHRMSEGDGLRVLRFREDILKSRLGKREKRRQRVQREEVRGWRIRE